MRRSDTTGILLGLPGRVILGIVLLLIGLANFVFFLWAWRTVEQAEAAASTAEVSLFGANFDVSDEVALVLLVLAASVLGSFVHSATSFVTYYGNRTLLRSWVPWYLFRALIGAALAVLVYFVVRAGFLSTGTTSEDVNTFGIVAIAGLVGLFSKQATDKLREVFDVLFNTSAGYGDEQRLDKSTIPTITALEPDTVVAGSAGVSLVIRGRAFVDGCQVAVDDRWLTANVESDRRLAVLLPDDLLSTPGELRIVVRNPDGSESGPVTFRVTA